MNMRKIVMLILCLSMILSSNSIFASEIINDEEINSGEYGTGLMMSDVVTEQFHSKIPKVVNVLPNEVALSRVEQNSLMRLNSNKNIVLPTPIGEEVIGRYSGETPDSGQSGETVNFPLPDSVDVSSSLTFPQIGNQGTINSCVPWSLLYYQLTNNTCLVKNKSARTTAGTNITQNIMSPRWIYTMTNFGRNIGTFYAEACAAIVSYGCPSTSDYSQTITTTNLRQWCTDSEIWGKANRNKPEQIMYDTFSFEELYGGNISNSDTLKKIKQFLSNGYVLTYSTNVGAYNYTRNTSNGQWGCRYVGTNSENWHAMTIVGYDDNFWIDVNGNAIQDSGEYGALKIANSWGTSATNYNNGFLWLSYDALGEISSVSGAATNRDRALWAYYFIKPSAQYEPLAVANVTISAKRRNQIGVEIGVAKNNIEEKISIVPNYHIAFSTEKLGKNSNYYTSQVFNFSGGTTEEEITLPIDLTPLLQKLYSNSEIHLGDNIEFNITVSDSDADGNYTYLKNVNITECATETVHTSDDTTTLIANNSSVSKNVDFVMSGYAGRNKSKAFTLNFSNNVYVNSVTTDTIFISDQGNVTFSADLQVDNKKVYVDCPFENGYLFNKIYKININNDLMSVGRNKAIKNYIIPIYFLGNYNEFFMEE